MPASALPEALLLRLLDQSPVARLALVDKQGYPEALPIVFARVARQLFSPVDGKPKKSVRLARLVHVEREPRVGLVIDRYDADWQQLWWVKLRTRAEVVVDGAHPAWQAAEAALRAKYPQYQDTALFLGVPTMLCFDIVDVRWWAAGGQAALEAAFA